MDLSALEVGVWHPFGPHSRETPEQIIERKRQEIVTNGWTLWTFQYRRPAVLATWARELSGAAAPVAFCSASAGAVDPAETGNPVASADCRSYQVVGEEAWRPMPAGVRATYHFRGVRRHASAFVVRRVVHPVDPVPLPAVEWLAVDGQWRRDRVPTRGEYLIRGGGTTPLRAVRALLELRPPYLAVVSAADA
jgi:hypothetical protein